MRDEAEGGRFLAREPDAHDCPRPHIIRDETGAMVMDRAFGAGTVWECECGRRWRRSHHGWWTRLRWPWTIRLGYKSTRQKEDT